MNLLPGLRELRAPLAAGYLWLIWTWLCLSELGWIPSKRPAGDDLVARVWDIGEGIGKAALFAILTFLAYLIGTFFETDVNGTRIQWLGRFVVGRRWMYDERGPVLTTPRFRSGLKTLEHEFEWDPFIPHIVRRGRSLSRELSIVINSFSPQATTDLMQALIEKQLEFILVIAGLGSRKLRQSPQDAVEAQSSRGAPKGLKPGEFTRLVQRYRVLALIIDETPQLASRLLVKTENCTAAMTGSWRRRRFGWV